MSGIFGFLTTPRQAKPSMSQPVETETSRSPMAMARDALNLGGTPASTAPDSSVVAKLPVSSRKQRAKPTATAVMDTPRDVFGMTPRPSAKHVYAVRKSAGRSADRIPRSQQKKRFRTLNKPNSLASPAASALAISNLLNSDAPSSGEEDEDDIPASGPSAASAASSIQRPAANKGVQPLFTQSVGAKDTSAMFEFDEEDQAPPTQRQSKAFKKAQAEEESRERLTQGKAVDAVTAEASSADVADESMDVDDSVDVDETTESAVPGNPQAESDPDETMEPADAEASQEESDADDDDENNANYCVIESLLKHRTATGGHKRGGNFDILVRWENGEESWEPEVILHEDAPDALFDYWESQNGRPDNGKGIYRAVRFTQHRRYKNRYQILVEWLGYPPEEQTWEMLAAMKKAAPEIYAEYRRKNPDAPR